MKCPICVGTGKVSRPSFSDASAAVERSCHACKGKGQLPEHADDLRTRLAEATALLDDGVRHVVCEPDQALVTWARLAQAFLSRAPAQPAAPEPSAFDERCVAQCERARWYDAAVDERVKRVAAEAQLAAVRLPPHEQSPEVRERLFPCLQVLADNLCQTQSYILRALANAGLTVTLLSPPSPSAVPGEKP